MTGTFLLPVRLSGGSVIPTAGGVGGISASRLFGGADAMNERQQSSTTQPYLFPLFLTSDHITGATGKSPTVTLSKNGAAFAAAAATPAEIGNGWYSLPGNATDRNTLGDLIVHATAAACDPFDGKCTIVPWDPFDGNLDLTGLIGLTAPTPGALPTVGTGANQIELTTGWVDTGKVLGVALSDSDETAAAVASNSITLDATTASNVAQFYQWQRLRIVSATTGQGQERLIIDYTTGRVATIDRPWAVTPTGTIKYQIMGGAYAGPLTPAAIAGILAGLLAVYGVQGTVATALSAGSFTGAAGLSATDQFYRDQFFRFTSGVNNGQTRKITNYVGSTRTFTFTGAVRALDEPFPATPGIGDTFDILARG